jgi:hypothetical protein
MEFWKKVFCEQDGTPSFSRVATGLLVAFACGWVTHVVAHSHQIPDSSLLLGLGAFMSVLYGANKLSGVFTKPPQ